MTEQQKAHIKRQLEKRAVVDEVVKVSIDLTKEEYSELLTLLTTESEECTK